MNAMKEPQSLNELLNRLSKARAEREPLLNDEKKAEKEAFTREIEKEANIMAAEFDQKGIEYTWGALLGMAENRILRRKFDEQAAEHFAQVAAIPRRFAHATLRDFHAFDGIQEQAFRRVCVWANGVRRGNSPWLVLSGSWGTGKSHLACAALNSLRDTQGLAVRFVAAIDLIRAIQGTYHGQGTTTEAQIIAELAKIDVLCLDDVAADPSPFEAKLIARILDARYRNDKPTLVVTNLGIVSKGDKPSKFDEYVGPLVASRIGECAEMVDCTTTDFRKSLRQRKAIAQAEAQSAVGNA